MSDIQFDEANYQTRRVAPQRRQSVLTRAVIATGLARDAAGAQRVMIVIAVLALLAAGYIYTSGRPHTITPQEAQQLLPR